MLLATYTSLKSLQCCTYTVLSMLLLLLFLKESTVMY